MRGGTKDSENLCLLKYFVQNRTGADYIRQKPQRQAQAPRQLGFPLNHLTTQGQQAVTLVQEWLKAHT